MADKPHGIRIEPGHKRVRAYLDGRLVADTTRPVLVWEWPYFPAYYLPAADIAAELVPAGRTEHSPSRGDAEVFHVKVATATAPDAALRYPDSPLEQLRDLVRLDWNSMTEWLEEDEPVYTHPRDPYSRVDILASSRHVRVEVDGVTVADSAQPRILFETGLPLVERIVTVTGLGVRRPSNLLVPVGTRLGDPVDACGGLAGDAREIVFAGPMVGAAPAELEENHERFVRGHFQVSYRLASEQKAVDAAWK